MVGEGVEATGRAEEFAIVAHAAERLADGGMAFARQRGEGFGREGARAGLEGLEEHLAQAREGDGVMQAGSWFTGSFAPEQDGDTERLETGNLLRGGRWGGEGSVGGKGEGGSFGGEVVGSDLEGEIGGAGIEAVLGAEETVVGLLLFLLWGEVGDDAQGAAHQVQQVAGGTTGGKLAVGEGIRGLAGTVQQQEGTTVGVRQGGQTRQESGTLTYGERFQRIEDDQQRFVARYRFVQPVEVAEQGEGTVAEVRGLALLEGEGLAAGEAEDLSGVAAGGQQAGLDGAAGIVVGAEEQDAALRAGGAIGEGETRGDGGG
jgi:hypothetical protein